MAVEEHFHIFRLRQLVVVCPERAPNGGRVSPVFIATELKFNRSSFDQFAGRIPEDPNNVRWYVTFAQCLWRTLHSNDPNLNGMHGRFPGLL